MHGFPWYFALLLYPETWCIVAAVIAGLIWYAVRRVKSRRASRAGTTGDSHGK